VIRIRRMILADVPVGMRLKEQAGWNQTEADWRRFLDLEPDGCFVADFDDEPVATTTTCVFGTNGWIAMVVVDVRLRGRGIGSALMRHALEYLDEQGVLTVRLDATPLGQPVYEKLGFVSDYALVRYEGVLPARDSPCEVELVRPENLDRICEFDRSVTSTHRGKLLTRLWHEGPERFRMVRSGEQYLGFLAMRPGAVALQMGPCIAAPLAAPRLFEDACHLYRNQRVYIDIPTGNDSATALAESLGLKAQRRLMRMHRGLAIAECIPMLWASSGPEKG
jgi:GNAT superfamily N-acetyltransferase